MVKAKVVPTPFYKRAKSTAATSYRAVIVKAGMRLRDAALAFHRPLPTI